ncbi:MAG: terminase small subunit [Nitrospirae bacterium]|nr:terminase small subunit [Nitrospirota bacterium]
MNGSFLRGSVADNHERKIPLDCEPIGDLLAMIVNKKQLSDILGKTEQTLTLWQKEGMPIKDIASCRGRKNSYETAEVINWLIERERGDDTSSYNAERTRLTRLQADKTSIEIATLTKELIPAEEAERHWGELVAAFRARMLAVPTKVSYQVLGLEDLHAIQRLLEDQVHEALNELKEYPDVFRKPDKNKRGNKKVGKGSSSSSKTKRK